MKLNAVALALLIAASAATAVGADVTAYSLMERLAQPSGNGPLGYRTGCRKPAWPLYPPTKEGRAEAAANYTIYYACVRQQSQDDERQAMVAIDQGARDEFNQVTAEGRAAGLVAP